jgi:hypothetical protein
MDDAVGDRGVPQGGTTLTQKNSMVPWCFFPAWSSTIASDDALAELKELTTEEKLAEKPYRNKA